MPGIRSKQVEKLVLNFFSAFTLITNFPIWLLCFGVMQVEDLIAKEREMQEKLMTRHSTVVDSFEKKLRGQDVENRIALQQQKIAALRQEVESLLEYISEI